MKNKKLKAIAGLVAVAVIGGSLAYFNQTMTVENPFDTNKYSSELVETFNPGDGDDWQPGATVNKDIQVDNTGDYDVIVRVKFDETWTRKGGNSAYVTNTGINDSTSQTDETDGLVTGDYSVVKKNLLNADKWFYNTNDGYYYYLDNLKAGQNTGTFLDSVKLIDNADMGKYEVIKYYTSADNKPADDVIGDDVLDEGPPVMFLLVVGFGCIQRHRGHGANGLADLVVAKGEGCIVKLGSPAVQGLECLSLRRDDGAAGSIDGRHMLRPPLADHRQFAAGDDDALTVNDANRPVRIFLQLQHHILKNSSRHGRPPPLKSHVGALCKLSMDILYR